VAAWYKLVGSRLVTRYWFVVVLGWLAIAATLRISAPAWEKIAADGDLMFLPPDVPSSQGQRVLETAFPGSINRSQLVLVIANQHQPLQIGDLALAMDLARHLHWLAARSAWQQLQTDAQTFTAPASPDFQDAGPLAGEQARVIDQVLAEVIRDNVTEVIEIEQLLSRFYEDHEVGFKYAPLPETFAVRSQINYALGEVEQAAIDADTAELIREQEIPSSDFALPPWYTKVRDVWSWRNQVLGHKLASADQHARLITLQLDSEFTATGNIAILEDIERLYQRLQVDHQAWLSPQLRIEASGSAAFGADMLRASAGGVRVTEFVTISLVVLILSLVYRRPFLVAIPLTSIALSLVVATSLIALLARDPAEQQGAGLGVFTTTRIFIVVILFGAGTDFCLFLIARCREFLEHSSGRSRRHMQRIVAQGWRSVHDAIVASAATTMVGLGLMWFSDFEKFRYSGPIIAIALGITLLVCLSFTPALLSGLGAFAFWPIAPGKPRKDLSAPMSEPSAQWYWRKLSTLVLGYPHLALTMTAVSLAVPAAYGFYNLRNVTYDLTEELSEDSPSRRGSRLIAQFFSTGDSSPVTLIVTRPEAFESEEALRAACTELAAALYTDGVTSVRSLTDPLGDYPPGKRMGLFDQDAWRRRLLQSHRMIKERFLSPVEPLSQRVARFDVILASNPFSLEASATLRELVSIVQAETQSPDSAWTGSQIRAAGTTAGITDLRQVTQADQRRIQWFVTCGVWLVLVLLLRKLILPTYLILTVLLSYFATLGITFFVFSSLYAPEYTGLDWKVPLFLFVILVAVGQDYNVYLVTRIFEEKRLTDSMAEGIRRALVLTGGIITSCGFVMAGTFIAMTSPAILHYFGIALPHMGLSSGFPVLRGITELGFALALGVLLDTLVVRTILVPTFMMLAAKIPIRL
jgi:putative drug exporter of the RND superfamily